EPGERVSHASIVTRSARGMHRLGRLCYGICVTTQVETSDSSAAGDQNVRAPERAWLERLDERTLPQFNQLVIWSLLVAAATLAFWRFDVKDGPRGGFVTLLSWLPDAVVRSSAVWLALRAGLIVGIVLWLMQCWLPWCCWLVVVSFTALWSL